VKLTVDAALNMSEEQLKVALMKMSTSEFNEFNTTLIHACTEKLDVILKLVKKLNSGVK